MLREPRPARTNAAPQFALLHVSTETHEDSSDVDEKEALIAEINESASAFQQVQDAMCDQSRFVEARMDFNYILE